LGEPLMSSTLLLPGDDLPITDCEEMAVRLRGDVDVIVDAGSCGIEPTTVIDLTGSYPVVLRHGKGSAEDFV
jgi:tRNA A37 threonylcarbamoyladenosine synthetase subunit TsaC/SUA5/YrdC